ncbi:MAG: pyruvate ferredoxin oxidoreductase [bacterium]
MHPGGHYYGKGGRMSIEFWNGNMAAAQAAKLARIQVIAAYPITPQTHTVEYLAGFIANGELNAELVKVESEHSALSVCAGASSVGARAFTASCSQGLQLMSEVLYFTSGMRFPVVMAIANRTLSVPVNIWADHQDTLVNRDCGWIQIYTNSVQEVYDQIFMAFRISEDDAVCLPVLISYDGFILSHASEVVKTIDQSEADAFLPKPGSTNRPLLDPDHPLQFGEVLFPNWYPDFEYKKHRALVNSKDVIRQVYSEFEKRFGRGYDLIDTYCCEDAEIIFTGIGSMMSTTRWVVDQLRERGEKVGQLNIRAFRPFPEEEIAEAVENAKTVAVLDRDIGYGTSGMVFSDITRALHNRDKKPKALNFIIGLGGKDIIPATIEKCFAIAKEGFQGQTVFWPDASIEEEAEMKPGVVTVGFGGT